MVLAIYVLVSLVLGASSIAQISLIDEDTFSNCQVEHPTPDCAAGSLDRTFDGSCNNLLNPTWGATNTSLLRLIEAEYADPNGLPRGFGPSPDLPSANRVSQVLFKVEQTNTEKNRRSIMFMTFGQFLDHDVAFGPHPSSSSCPVDDCNSDAAFTDPCFPIKFGKRQSRCTPFARTLPICPSNVGFSTGRDQFNSLTAFVDGSQIYGISDEHSKALRTNNGAGSKMKLNNKGLLPIDKSITECNILGGCSLLGDFRGDENIALLSMHTLWVREHNRLAEELKRRNRGWDNERLFRTARKINIAQFQHIVYEEWLPQVVDLDAYTGYKSHVNPSIANSFASAAFRFGHSLVPNFFTQLDYAFNEKFKPVNLRQAFENRRLIVNRGIEPTIFGLVGNRSNPVDPGFAFAIARRLFIKPGQATHRDLTAFNIQRGRDHGIPTYGKWRTHCSLPKLETNKQINRVFKGKFSKALKTLGQNVDDLDLFAAGISEKSVKGKLVGPTFGCIIKDQFERLRDGDRFFYKADGVFSNKQLKAIKKVTLSSIICQNLKGIVSIQRNSFIVPKAGKVNAFKECGTIGHLNVAVFN